MSDYRYTGYIDHDYIVGSGPEYLVQLPDLEIVQAMVPDHHALRQRTTTRGKPIIWYFMRAKSGDLFDAFQYIVRAKRPNLLKGINWEKNQRGPVIVGSYGRLDNFLNTFEVVEA